MSMSVKQGLYELESIRVKIESGIEKSTFIELKKNDIKSVSYQSIIDLLERRNHIKASIVQSNAVTIVTIAGKTYTVADALERKRNIGYEKKLLSQMKYQWEDSIDEFYMHPEDETEDQPFCSGCPPCLNCNKCLMERYNSTKASIIQRNAKLGKETKQEQIIKQKVGVCCNCPPCWNCSKCCLCCLCASFCEHNVKSSTLPETCMGKNKAEFAENIKNLFKSIKEFNSQVCLVLDESDTKTLIQ